MKTPIIQIKNFSGGITLNEKMGRDNQFFRGNKLDFSSKLGYLAPSSAWKNVQLGGANDVGTRFPWMLHLTNDEFMLGGEDAKIYKLSSDLNSISVVNTSTQTGAISGVAEYKDYFYYAQATTIGRYGSLSGTPTWTDNWQTGLQNVSYHPMKVSTDKKLYIGNGQYVAKYDGTTFTSNALDLDTNWQIRCLEDFGMPFLAIGASFVRTTGKSLVGKVFLWDRISPSWNDEIIIPETEIKAMKYYGGYLWIWAGRSCNLYVASEGSRVATRVLSFVKENPTEYFEVYPGSIIIKNGVIYFGLSKVGSDSKEKNPCGIYSFPYNPNNFSLNLPYTEFFDDRGFKENYKGLGLFHGGEGVEADIILASYHNLNQNYQYLYREKLAAADTTFYGDTATFESFRYKAPSDKKILTEAFGVKFESLPANCLLSLYYQKDYDNWVNVFSNFSTQNAIEKITYKRVEANSLKLKLTIRGSNTGGERPFVDELFVTGNLISKV